MKDRIEQLKANRNQGASLAIVLCICTLLMAFSLAIVYLAGLLMANANARNVEERAYQLARSFAHVMDTELRLSGNSRDNAASSEFYKFANDFMDKKEYFDKTTYYYKVENMPELASYGDIKISLRKEKNSGEETATSGELQVSDGNYGAEISRLQSQEFFVQLFSMTVTSTYQDTSYSYEMSYYRQDTYLVQFHRSSDNTVIVWNNSDNTWRSGTETGTTIDLKDGETIKYTYLTDKPVTSIFSPIHKEAR